MNRRGRPPKVKPMETMAEERSEQRKAERKQRRRTRMVGVDHRSKLGLPDSVTKHGIGRDHKLHWVNDEGSKLHDAYNDDYDFVSHDEIGVQPGEDPITGKPVGDRVSKVVGTDSAGKPLYAYLMKKPREFQEQDEAEKEQRLKEIEEPIFRGIHGEGDEHRYIPKEGIKQTRK